MPLESLFIFRQWSTYFENFLQTNSSRQQPLRNKILILINATSYQTKYIKQRKTRKMHGPVVQLGQDVGFTSQRSPVQVRLGPLYFQKSVNQTLHYTWGIQAAISSANTLALSNTGNRSKFGILERLEPPPIDFTQGSEALDRSSTKPKQLSFKFPQAVASLSAS